MARKCQNIYEDPIIFKDEKWTIRVYHPILTEEEQAKRMKQIHDSAAALIIDTERRKRMRKEAEVNPSK